MRHRPFAKIAGPGDPLGAVPGGPWVALEKIHGAQMVVAVRGDDVRFGKRKAWLADDDPFFGWQLVRQPLGELARAAARRLGAPLVVLYGELFGGGYPHPAVPAAPGLQPVQTGIWYAPDLRWAVFDALVAADEADDGDVIRPDARARPGGRPVYKRKIAEFDEQRFAESEAWDPAQRPGRDALVAWARRLVNPARLASAASKCGRHDREAVLDELELDVLIDLTAAFPAALADLSPADEAALRAELRAAAAALPL